MLYKGTYYNGYAGCDETLYFRSDSLDKVNAYMNEGLFEYAESYDYLAEGCSFDDGWEDDELMNDYHENCGYEIEEVDENDEDLEYEKIIEI